MNITTEGEMPKSTGKGGVKTSQAMNNAATPKKKTAKPKTKKK